MLKDRLELLEQEIDKLSRKCGNMYIAAIREEPSTDERWEYQTAVGRLTTMKTEMSVIQNMIKDGHE